MRKQNEKGLPYWASFGLCLCFFWITNKLWQYSKAGSDLASIGAALFFLLSGKQFVAGVSGLWMYLWERKIEKDAARKDDKHGKADWATIEILEKAGMTKPGGILLGEKDGSRLFANGEAHLLTIGPPGSGKTTSHVVPNLLTWEGSIFDIDPTGEHYLVTSDYRRDVLGQEVILICPDAEKMSAEFGVEMIDRGFNIFGNLGQGAQVKDTLEKRSAYLSPGKASMNASDEFWNDGGSEVVCFGASREYVLFGEVDPVRVRKFTMLPMDELYGAFVEMEQSDAFDGYLSEMASKYLGLMKKAPQQFAGILGSAQKAMRIYDPYGSIGRSSCRSGVDFSELKKRNVSVYIVPPSGTPEMQGRWMGPIVSTAIEQLCSVRNNTPVLMLIDEFANIGFLPSIRSDLAQCRKFGLRISMIIQSLSQIERVYGREGMREIVSMCGGVSALSVTDQDTLKYFSDWMGTTTERQFNQSITPNQRSGEFSYNYSASDMAVPLRRAEEIRQMDANEGLLVYKDLPPIKYEKVSYIKCEELRKLAKDNPYYT